MSLSNAFEILILNHIFGKTELVYDATPSLFIGLSVGDPGEAAASLAEPVAMSYVRKAIGAVTLTGSTITNDAEIAFAAASGAWGTITHAALFDAETEGTMLWSGALSQQKVVASGDVVKFAAGALSFTLD